MDIKGVLAATGLIVLISPAFANAASDECNNIGSILSAQGSVQVKSKGSNQWDRLSRNAPICEGDTVKTGFRSRAAISLVNETVMRVKQGSTATLDNFSSRSDAKSILRLISGVIHFFSRKPREYSIATTTATIGIRGTEFVVTANDTQTDLTVFEGEVIAANDISPLSLSGGQMVRITKGKALSSETPLNPRDQVQWGLYYPPILSASSATSGAIQQAMRCAQQGDYTCAFESLENIPGDNQDAEYLITMAALLLAVGDVTESEKFLLQARSIDPDNANIPALNAIISVTQNDPESALGYANRAVALDPESLAAKISLSYVLQARLDLDGAQNILLAATNQHPQDALAWARYAEILLAQGQTKVSREAAAKAVKLDANLSRTHMVLGYAALSQFDAEAANQSFKSALSLDSADPMAHLGLGLGLIRLGALEDGRKEIEAAVALDSGSSILRSYLGRAYYEEKRSPLDAEQYAMARQLDPNDPTAYLFDALRKHSENRPIEARQDLLASIERNDNRAVYRGRNLLDQDRAARGASLARIYDTLGFSSQGIASASESISIDPANDSAHRFLSDSYQNLRRREISRVSELLQAQLLQDINLNPVQPSVSATNLNIGSGAGDVGLNEFTGLFESNGIQPGITLSTGSNATRATEAVLSGIHNSLSYSLGAYQHETDGWRENNAQDQDLGNLFLQWSARSNFSIQAEVSSRSSSEGDLAFNFDPDDFDDSLNVDRELDSERIGLRFSPTTNSDLLVSYINSERSEVQNFVGDDLIPNSAFPSCLPFCQPFAQVDDATLKLSQKDEGSQSEIQYIHKFDRVNLIVGLAEADVDTELDFITDNADSLIASSSISKLSHSRSYLYANFNMAKSVDVTIGASKDDYKEETTDESVTSPKLGVSWKINDQQTLRLASFEVLKPALVNNRTLEPTQIAGFNQFFDDINATKSKASGIGYDFKINPALTVGAEISTRDMEEPVVTETGGGPETIFENREESYQRIFAHWAASKRIALSVEIISDRYEAESGIATQNDNLPELAKTKTLPISLKYFSESGWYAGITATMVDQEITRDPFALQASGEDSFEVVDLSFGYRLPKRLGTVGLEIHNLGDETFSYQDDSYREFRNEPSIGPYFPERTVLLRASLAF
ncbi:MAG: Tfp pilus assembly protein PilF [Gammaproteobacteria bacterium]|jgi:Tfp pilus assembly protein PilF